MTHEAPYCLEFLTIIAGRKLKDSITESLSNEGGRLITVMYGKGSVKSDYLRDMFGLVPEENKVIITCLLPCKQADAVFDMLVNKFHFNKPNTGIAFTVPINLSL